MRAFFVLLTLFAAGCAHRPAAEVIQLRQLVGRIPSIPGERTHFAYVELTAGEGAEPRLSVFLLGPDGSRFPVVHASQEEAETVLAQVRDGEPLAERLPSYLPVGMPPTSPLAHPSTFRLAAPLEDMRLSLAPFRDPAAGELWRMTLALGGTHQELGRFFVPAAGSIEWVAMEPDAAAVQVTSRTEAGWISDVIPVDLLAGASALLVTAARDEVARGDLGAAAASLARAETLGADDPGELWYEKARVRALSGRPAAEVVEALRRAIPSEPALYRMRARIDEAFRPLRRDASFQEAVAPRILPGSNRVGRPDET